MYILKQMDAALDALESNPAGFIHEGSLKDEVEPGLKLIAQLTDGLTEEANSIMNRVADTAALPHLDDSEVQGGSSCYNQKEYDRHTIA